MVVVKIKKSVTLVFLKESFPLIFNLESFTFDIVFEQIYLFVNKHLILPIISLGEEKISDAGIFRLYGTPHSFQTII